MVTLPFQKALKDVQILKLVWQRKVGVWYIIGARETK